MATVVTDLIDGARWTETEGTVTEIVRKFAVSDLPTQSAGGFTADEVIRTILDDAGIPQPGDEHPIESGLFVSSRAPKIIEPTLAMVDVTYTIPGRGAFEPPAGSTYVLSGGSTAEQVETWTERDGTTPVEVEHLGDVQTGEIRPFEARETIRLSRQMQLPQPWADARELTNRVNAQNNPAFFMQPNATEARTWLVTEVGYELVNASTLPFATYTISFTVAHNVDGWDPKVIYIDKETGRPPEGVLDSPNGFKVIPWYFEWDFSQIFG